MPDDRVSWIRSKRWLRREVSPAGRGWVVSLAQSWTPRWRPGESSGSAVGSTDSACQKAPIPWPPPLEDVPLIVEFGGDLLDEHSLRH